jgi:hypothetical protein
MDRRTFLTTSTAAAARILIVATDRKLMRNHPAPLVTIALVAVTTCAIIAAVLGMFLL